MADSGIFRLTPLQGWQRDAILKAASFLRAQYGSPPSDPSARLAHEGLLEVLDPSRRTSRLQKEMSEAAKGTSTTAKSERRAGRDRRGALPDRRRVDLGPPPGLPERRKGDRRIPGGDRRAKK